LDLKEKKLAEARLRQIEIENQRAQAIRLQQKEINQLIRNEVSGIGKGVKKLEPIGK